MIISINGAQGSGKSTVAKMIADKLDWPQYNIGGLRRKIAGERGLTLAEYNKIGETDPTTDKEVDEYQKKLGETQDNFIIEGRTSWYLIPHSFKVYLDVEENEGVKRVFGHLQQKNDRNEDKGLDSLESVKKSMRRRLKSDSLRYKKYYNINVNDVKHYDFYLDTTNLNQGQVFDQVYKMVKNQLDKAKN